MKKISILSLIFIIIDFVIKFVIDKCMNVYDTIRVIPNFFSIMYVRNTGAAFSIMENNRVLFIAIGIISIYLIWRFLIKDKDLNKYYVVIYSMLIAGIIGNMIDRIIYGYVIDYVSFNIIGYSFPIFNLADIFIVVSVIMLIIYEGMVIKWKN